MTSSHAKSPTLMDVGADDGRGPFTAGLAAATSVGLSPRWVQYSGISAAACKVGEALADLATMNTRGGQRPTLDREFLAYVAGLSRADKLTPYLRELQNIGFLTVFDGGVDPLNGKRQQRRGQDGRPLPDHFEIALEPPLGYVGPRNLTQVHAQFITDRDAVYRAVEEAGKTPRVGRHAIPRTEVGRLESPQVAAVPQIRGQSADPVPQIRGQGKNPQVAAVPQIRGPLQIDQRSSISEREIEGSMEPVPGGAAGPPATGMDEQLASAVRDRVLQLGWLEWAERRGIKNFELGEPDVDLVQTAMCSVIADGRVDLATATKIAQHALVRAKSQQAPAVYVAGAFSETRLVEWLRRTTAVKLSDNPLPLPGASAAQADVAKANGQPDREKPRPVLPEWCGTCGEGVSPAAVRLNPRLRLVQPAEYGQLPSKCPVCHPDVVNPASGGDTPVTPAPLDHQEPLHV
jgi:hypothetical protein